MIHMKISHQDFVEFNNELTLALLYVTQGQFHNCAQLVDFQGSDLLLCLNFQILIFLHYTLTNLFILFVNFNELLGFCIYDLTTNFMTLLSVYNYKVVLY